MPGLDITPRVPAGRQLIQGYGGGRFRIAGAVHEASVLVFAEETRPWPVTDAAQITRDALAAVTAAHGKAGGGAGGGGILIIGCGPAFMAPPKELKRELREAGLVMEWMDTGAACRTFNVLLAEDRAFAAALIAVD